MKIILTQTVPKLGKEGQVVTVASGFARNFLFPKGMARMADKAGIARLDREREKLAADAEKTKGSAQKLAEKLSGATVRITGQTAKGSTKLFGAVTAADVADIIKSSLKVEVDKRSVALMHPIKRLGVYNVMVDLHRDVDAMVKVEVADEHGFLGIDAAPEVAKPTDAVAEAEAPTGVEEPVAEEPVPEQPVEA